MPRDRAALFGPEGRIEFHPYDSDKAFARVTDGTDDLFFLDGPDIGDHRLAGAATLGPAVYFVSTAAMVHGPTPIQRLSDLAGKSICFYQGDNAHLNLEATMGRSGSISFAWGRWNTASFTTPTIPESAMPKSARARLLRPQGSSNRRRPPAAS